VRDAVRERPRPAAQPSGEPTESRIASHPAPSRSRWSAPCCSA